MHVFYCPDVDPGRPNTLDTEESHHCTHVLRLRAGDTIRVMDGTGRLYPATLTGTGGTGGLCAFTCDGPPETQSPRPYFLHVALAPTKHTARFEWFLEKAVELGVDEITPLLCARSERRRVNEGRMRKIVISAMKQSRNGYLPVLHPMTPFGEIVRADGYDGKYICGMDVSHGDGGLAPRKKSLFLVGPEGDFTDEERSLAGAGGFAGLSLGTMRLRTETAGVHICSIMSFLHLNKPTDHEK